MPTVAVQFQRLAEEAVDKRQSHLDYLEAVLSVEMEEREQNAIQRRLKEAHLQRIKTLDEFDFNITPQIAATKLRDLALGAISNVRSQCCSSVTMARARHTY